MADRIYPVVVTVTNKKIGTWSIAPFSDREGLEKDAIYDVPIYEITVGATQSFKAIRFGLVRRNQNPPPKQRICDAGLSSATEAQPTWISGYSPHSFQGQARPGAWRIFPKPAKPFLIHEGPSDSSTMIGGSLGCIEIVGQDEWDRFLGMIELFARAGCSSVGQAGALLLKIEKASYPTAELVTR